MRRISSATLFTLLSVFVTLGASADTVQLRNGETVTGTVVAEALTLETADRGDLVIPVSSIAEVRFREDGDVSVTLVDGSELHGELAAETIVLSQDLFSNSFDVQEIASITVAPRVEAVTIPKGTPVHLMLAEWLHSHSAQPGDSVRFCLAEDAQVGGARRLPKGMPAFGEVTVGRQAGRTLERGEVVVEPRYLLAADGGHLPLTGASGEFSGGVNAAAFVTGGVLGFLDKGEEVNVPPGTVLEAVTETTEELPRAGNPEGEAAEAWEECERFFRFTDVDVVPVEETDLQEAYAPFGTSLTASIPLDDLADLDKGETLDRSLRNLMAYDTYLQTVSVSVDHGRKRVRLPVHVFLVVLPSHDKRVDLELSLVDGDKVLAQQAEKRLDAEEKKAKRVQMTLTTDTDAFDRALSAGDLSLRISMTVRE